MSVWSTPQLDGVPAWAEYLCTVANKSGKRSITIRLMHDWIYAHELIGALLSLGVSLVTLGATLAAAWAFGQRLTFQWNIRQKRRELQMSASQQFYAAYGEFFSIWKLWNRLDRKEIGFDDRRWDLHKRAASAEATVEGTLVKVSSELILDPARIAELAMFRQGFQQLRQSIRSDVELAWGYSEHPQYLAFKLLAARVALLLAADWKTHPPTVEVAGSQLLEITHNRWETVWAQVPISGFSETYAASLKKLSERLVRR